MTRLVMISALLIAGLATTGAALLATQKPKSARPAVPAKAAAQKRKPDKPAAPEKKVELISVRVVDTEGRDVPNVEVEVVDQRSTAEGRRYRTGADGRFRVPSTRTTAGSSSWRAPTIGRWAGPVSPMETCGRRGRTRIRSP